MGRKVNGLQIASFSPCILSISANHHVVEEWFKQGKPKTGETRHDFREWCQALDWIVQNIFKEAPLMDGHDQAQQRAASPNLTFVRLLAVKLNEAHHLAQGVTASDLADICMEADIEIPGLSLENQTTEQGPRQIGKIMGQLFKDATELALDDFTVVRTQEEARTSAGNLQTLNRYNFTLVNPSSSISGQTSSPLHPP